VHRQAADNPIVRLSMDIREGRGLETGVYGETQVVSRHDLDPARVLDAHQVLVAVTPRDAPTMRGCDSAAACRRYARNRRQARLPAQQQAQGLFNGALWSVKEKPTTRRDFISMRLQPDDGFARKGIKVSVRPECFHRRHRKMSNG